MANKRVQQDMLPATDMATARGQDDEQDDIDADEDTAMSKQPGDHQSGLKHKMGPLTDASCSNAGHRQKQ